MPQVTCCTGVLVYAEMKLIDRKLRTITIDDKTISGNNTDLGSPIMFLLISSDSTNTYKTPMSKHCFNCWIGRGRLDKDSALQGPSKWEKPTNGGIVNSITGSQEVR